MNGMTPAILCQLEAIREIAERDCLTVRDYIMLRCAACDANTALERAIDRALRDGDAA
jgi:hypothetical protein